MFLLNLNTIFSIRLDRFDRNLTARLIKKYLNNNQEGFTLVELIVVVVIIGILSAIAIPSFQNASDKAKQKEAAILIASYMKGVQAYYVSYGNPPVTDKDLSEFVSVLGCASNVANGMRNPTACKTNPLSGPTNTRFWNSPSGIFNITLGQRNGITNISALPAGDYSNDGYGVIGCFNHQTGSTKVVLLKNKGREVFEQDC